MQSWWAWLVRSVYPRVFGSQGEQDSDGQLSSLRLKDFDVWTNSWAEAAGCCTQGTTVWRGWGCACMFAPSVFPGWSGRRWAGSGVQARSWVGGWCGWRTCRRGFQKTAPSWILVLETPRQLLPLQDSRPELSWHKHGTHSRTFKEPGHEEMSVLSVEINHSPGRKVENKQ